MKTTNIYVILDPDRKFHAYIGKADNPEQRFKQHIKDARDCSKLFVHQWIRILWSIGKQPTMVVQHWDVPEDKWSKLEKQTIKLYKVFGWKLKNLNDGGKGNLGYKFSEEYKKEKSELMKMTGKTAGENSARSKLTEKQVKEIRSLAGKFLQKEIGKMFAVSESAIHKILSRKRWKHI